MGCYRFLGAASQANIPDLISGTHIVARMPLQSRQRRIPACNFVVHLGDDESGMAHTAQARDRSGPPGSHPSARLACSAYPAPAGVPQQFGGSVGPVATGGIRSVAVPVLRPHTFWPCRSRHGPTVAWYGTDRFEPLLRCTGVRHWWKGTDRFAATLPLS